MDNLFQTSLLIPPNDIDFTNHLKASAIFNYIQNTASSHAEQLQLGYLPLKQAGLFWVLSWVRVEFDDYPQYRDPITVDTWPHCRHRLFSIRDFLFSKGDGRAFCRARSAWLLLDLQAKRITSLERLPRPVPYLNEHSVMDILPEKLPALEGAKDVLERQIGYTDLDLNQHTNNAKYVEFLQDTYSQDFYLSRRIKALTISFQNETKYGDHLVISKKPDEQASGRDHISARLAGNGKIVFRAIVNWE